MNGVLFRMLFGRSWLADYQSFETRLSTIERQISIVTNGNQESRLHAESILLEEFRRASIMTYQVKEEMTNTFNVYLIAVGVVVTVITTLETLILRPENSSDIYISTLFETIIIGILVVSGIVNWNFQLRFIQLAQDHFDNITSMNKIKEHYANVIPSVKDIFYKQRGEISAVPAHIRETVFLLGSLCFGGATYILSGFFVKFGLSLIELLPEALLTTFITVISWLLYRWYYHNHI